MKAALLAVLAALASLAVAPVARADDTVRACIAASTDGQTLRKQGKLLAARDQLIACARDACPAIVRSHCARWLSEVDGAIPSVVVRAENANGSDALGARVSIDGRAGKLDGQPVRLDPGEHTVAVEAGGSRREERVLLAEGEMSRLVRVRLPGPPVASSVVVTPSTSAPPPGGRYAPAGAWILGGAGVVALGGSTAFAIAANNALSGLQSTCSPHCSDAQTRPGRTDALLFDVLLGVGGAAVAGALVWGIGFPSHATASQSALRLDVRPLPGGAFTALSLSY